MDWVGGGWTCNIGVLVVTGSLPFTSDEPGIVHALLPYLAFMRYCTVLFALLKTLTDYINMLVFINRIGWRLFMFIF